MKKLVDTLLVGTSLLVSLTACDLEVLPMPAGVAYVDSYDCGDCYDVVETGYVVDPLFYPVAPVFYRDSYVEETWIEEPAYEEVYDAGPWYGDEVYVEGGYETYYDGWYYDEGYYAGEYYGDEYYDDAYWEDEDDD